MDSNMDWLSDFLDESIPIWRDNPVIYFREVLQFEPDEWQAEAAMDLAHNPKVSIKSGQGVGKTGLEAAVFLWFITCFPYPRIVATAPTKQQLHDVLWSEISKWMSKSPLLSQILKWTKTYVYMVGNEKRWFGVARTATKPENMQGFHEDNMLLSWMRRLVSPIRLWRLFLVPYQEKIINCSCVETRRRQPEHSMTATQETGHFISAILYRLQTAREQTKRISNL